MYLGTHAPCPGTVRDFCDGGLFLPQAAKDAGQNRARVFELGDHGALQRAAVHAVAEHVHLPEIVEQLKIIGVDYAQGYWLGEPRALELCSVFDETGIFGQAVPVWAHNAPSAQTSREE